MKQLGFKISLICLWAAPTFADDPQSQLAREIESTSVTSNQFLFDTETGVGGTLFPPIIRRNQMEINGCDVTARAFKLDAQTSTEEKLVEITFDLSRTRIPDASVLSGDEFGFVTYGADSRYGSALFELHFVPPYEPTIWSSGYRKEVERRVHFTRFLMEPVVDETQPRHLLNLLNQYKDEYCTSLG